MSDEYLTRVALHGTIPDDDVPSDIEITAEEDDAIVEVLFVRVDDDYWVLSRRYQTLYIDHGGGAHDKFSDALANAIETARSEGLPILKQVYTWVPEDTANELGADRIPIPWKSDGDDEKTDE